MERDQITEALEGVGATVLANACGPCIGQWKREEKKDEENGKSFAAFRGCRSINLRIAILTSFNRYCGLVSFTFLGTDDSATGTSSLATMEIVKR